MKALRAHHRGGPEALVFEDAPRPEPGAGEVSVDVSAASITFAELSWDETWTRGGVDRTPVIPAHEVSGIVARVGSGVSDLRVGQEVFGLLPFDRDGAAAECTVTAAQNLASKPVSLSYAQAAAVPLAALTAWQALSDHAHLRQGERVLIHGGAGGVGLFAVQLAHEWGAHVTATCRRDDFDVVTSAGADRVIDFESTAFGSESDSNTVRYEVVLDTVGGSTLERSYGVVRPGGRLITLQAPPSDEELRANGITGAFFIVAPDRAQLDQLTKLIDAGRLTVTIAAAFPLSQGRAAFESAAAPGRKPGKTVLIVRPEATTQPPTNGSSLGDAVG